MVRFRREDIRPLVLEFERLCFVVFRHGKFTQSRVVRDRRIRAWTGCSSTTIAKVWFLLNQHGRLPILATEERLLWGLHLLKRYDTDENNAARFNGVDEETFAKWAWWFIDNISWLESEVILWENRLINDIGNDCLASVDCVDCKRTGQIMYNERGRRVPDKRFYSFKKKIRGPALRYEVAISILSSDIVWIAGTSTTILLSVVA